MFAGFSGREDGSLLILLCSAGGGSWLAGGCVGEVMVQPGPG